MNLSAICFNQVLHLCFKSCGGILTQGATYRPNEQALSRSSLQALSKNYGEFKKQIDTFAPR